MNVIHSNIYDFGFFRISCFSIFLISTVTVLNNYCSNQNSNSDCSHTETSVQDFISKYPFLLHESLIRGGGVGPWFSKLFYERWVCLILVSSPINTRLREIQTEFTLWLSSLLLIAIVLVLMSQTVLKGKGFTFLWFSFPLSWEYPLPMI